MATLQPCGTHAAYTRGCRCDLCKEASREQYRNWRKNNLEHSKKQRRSYYEANKDAVKITTKRSQLRKIGLTLEKYNELLASISNCDICGVLFSDEVKACADHDHETGKFRGFLCASCNSAAGMCKDSSAVADRLATYLRKHGK